MNLHSDEAPQLGITGVGHVSSREPIQLILTSSEEIGWFDLHFTDAVGEHHEVQSVQISKYELSLTISTSLVVPGRASLRATVANKGFTVGMSSRTILVEG